MEAITDFSLRELISDGCDPPSHELQWSEPYAAIAYFDPGRAGSGKSLEFKKAFSTSLSLKSLIKFEGSESVQAFKARPHILFLTSHQNHKSTISDREIEGNQTFSLQFKTENGLEKFYKAYENWKEKPDSDSSKQNGSKEIQNVFDKKIEASSAKMYFHYYGQLLHQQNMLQDYVRTGTYYAAVMENKIDFENKIVVDVGAGSGILSLFAAQAGAKHVYAIEASSMSEYAKKLITGNAGMKERITVIHGKIEEVDIPVKADVLISEPMGTLLINERMLESYVIARDKFLKPNGKMFPMLGRIHLAPFSDEYLFVEIANKSLFWLQQGYYGVNLNPLHADAFSGFFSQPVVDAFDPRVLVSASIYYTIDFSRVKEEGLFEIDIPFNFECSASARVHGMACWFDVLFDGSSQKRWLTTAPGSPTTHWYQLRCVLTQPIYVFAGQRITGRMHMIAHNAQSYTIHLTMNTVSWGQSGTQNEIMQSATGKFDLKEPYYRMSQAPVYSNTQDQQQLQSTPPINQGMQQGSSIQMVVNPEAVDGGQLHWNSR